MSERTEAGEACDECMCEEETIFSRSVLRLFAVVFGVVLLIVVAGEWLGLFETVTRRVPWCAAWGLDVGQDRGHGLPSGRRIGQAQQRGEESAPHAFPPAGK